MKTQPIIPALFDCSDPTDALALARQVFLGGNGLPGRWAGRQEFVILETGFGPGHNFLATWDAWARDPARCRRLIFISIEKQPLRSDDLSRAHAQSALPHLAAELLQQWPPLTPNLHRLCFEAEQVQLLLCLGDVHDWLRELVATVDAFYLDGCKPAMSDAYVLKALGRRAAPSATLACRSAAPALVEGLAAAGFQVTGDRGFTNKGGMCVARHQPRHPAQQPAAREPLAPAAKSALIIGAGLAGAACAWALAQQGIRSTLLDSHPAIAQGSSGNPGGLFHGTLNPDDGIHARFNRASALETERVLRNLPPLGWQQRGLLRLEGEREPAQMQALIDRLGLPSDYVQAMSAGEASQRSGLSLNQPAWFYPGGGALAPPDYVQALLSAAKAEVHLNQTVSSISKRGDQWCAWGAQGELLGEAPLLLLAGGHQGQVLLQDLAPQLASLLRCSRGQLTHLAHSSQRPQLPVAGAGYAIADTEHGLWCGATSQEGDGEPGLRSADQQHNLQHWARLAGFAAPPNSRLAGRVGWRLATPDRLPLVGGLPVAGYQGRIDQARFVPRQAGLAVCMAMGSRGIAWAALCAQVLAAQVTGAPVPLETRLLDAIDPARFAVRAGR